MENKIIECKIIYPLKSALAQGIFMMAGTVFTISLARIFDNPIVFCCGFLIFFIIPAFYNQPIKNYFTKSAIFHFGDDGFSIEILDVKKSIPEEKFGYLYAEITGCTLSAKQNQYSAIILFLDNKKTERFTFVNDSELETAKIIYDIIIANSS